MVGGAPIPNLAALHQRVHGADDFLGRCTGVRLVEQIEIEVVGTEPPEAALGLLEEEVARKPGRLQVVAFVCGNVRNGATLVQITTRSRWPRMALPSAASEPPQP